MIDKDEWNLERILEKKSVWWAAATFSTYCTASILIGPTIKKAGPEFLSNSLSIMILVSYTISSIFWGHLLILVARGDFNFDEYGGYNIWWFLYFTFLGFVLLTHWITFIFCVFLAIPFVMLQIDLSLPIIEAFDFLKRGLDIFL